MRSTLHGLGLAALISAGAVSGAWAAERYGGGYGYGTGYGFADPAIGGDYIGAPLTRFPRPAELVPPAWGYGTYGVPTVTGIRQAPTAAPTVTVINSYEAPSRRGSAGSSVRSRRGDSRVARNGGVEDASPGDVRLISVTVPRR